MFLELITPLMIATAPMSITTPDATYDHRYQVSTMEEVQQRSFNGTRTFDNRGQPRDNDND